jgi:hypothetical protein
MLKVKPERSTNQIYAQLSDLHKNGPQDNVPAEGERANNKTLMNIQ